MSECVVRMENPDDCLKCGVRHICNPYVDYWQQDTRKKPKPGQKGCLIICSLPEGHGDLIDRDVLLQTFQNADYETYNDYCEAFDTTETAETIVPGRKERNMKYRKKPVVIEAYQTDKELDIETLEGTMHASVGDYIITGVRGEQYPCKPDIFEQTYEPADAPTASLWHRVEEPPRDGQECIIAYSGPTDWIYEHATYHSDLNKALEEDIFIDGTDGFIVDGDVGYARHSFNYWMPIEPPKEDV